MKKCDFCTQSDENGKCKWSLQISKEPYCKEAIKHMIEAMGNKKAVQSDGNLEVQHGL